MKCKDLQAIVIEYLYNECDDDQFTVIKGHLEVCANCRSKAESLRQTMGALDEWKTSDAPLDDDAIHQLASGHSAARKPRHETRFGWMSGALSGAMAAAVTFLTLAYLQTTLIRNEGTLEIHFGEFNRTASQSSDFATDDGEFMLLLVRDPRVEVDLDTVNAGSAVNEYRAWAGRIHQSGRAILGRKLTSPRFRLSRRRDGTLDTATILIGTEDSSTTVVSGYFRIAATSWDDALAVAQTCPHLKYGGSIELREVDSRTRSASP